MSEAACVRQEVGESWALYQGDCCEVLKGLPDASIGLCIHSPPFANLYIYSDSIADMGNCVDIEEFFEHYKYAIAELFRVTVTGRLCVVHCKDLPKYANRDGTAGLIDFPGRIVTAFEACGWSYHSRVTIWKCPVTERERTNNNGLLHKTAERDRSQLRQGMADYLIVMRKPPVGTLMSDDPVTLRTDIGFTEYVGSEPVNSDRHPSPYARKEPSKQKTRGKSIDIWRRYAEPVWWDVNQVNVLNYRKARDERDERHICPLQLDVIDRCIQIWSNKGDVVLDLFNGIGSTGVMAVMRDRRYVGIELKESYFDSSVKHLKVAMANKKEEAAGIFDE